ncbi:MULTISPECIES: hypothetical protein [Burkholderiaceae]|uniref:Uncharacterized protein n=1 Tax=Paraburkholderia domus TaxID=2793075 RepID=A0A9N8NF87_9BURK|nr:hypothetical protein [Burkholderia sp. R-70006]MBK5066111.1 hypothetical protein [Burkholderia sp. R-70199]MBK5169713.1 hypothetical protein [Burkholderia sp. R-70211]MBK5185414.1 hypothetical protein [Burkholderia sp. R-69749]CAE6861393.1 hypothetical protein R70006_08104 [Paraburkholderia domus]
MAATRWNAASCRCQATICLSSFLISPSDQVDVLNLVPQGIEQGTRNDLFDFIQPLSDLASPAKRAPLSLTPKS